MIKAHSKPIPFLKLDTLSLLQIVTASLFLALSSQISIPLYFTPIPITLQTLAVMFIGASLGSKKGALSILLYLLEGAIGLPVFAGGAFGLVHLFGTRCGYFLGFIVQAFIVGFFAERQRSFLFGKTLSVLLFSSALQMGLGVLGLSLFFGLKTAFIIGFVPFIMGGVIKSVCVAAYLSRSS